MKKLALRSGMLTLHANGKIRMVVNGSLLSQDGGWIPLSSFYENLESRTSPTADIMAISQRLTGANLAFSNWTVHTIETWLLWKRKTCTAISSEPDPLARGKIYAVIDGKEYTKEELMEGIVNIIRTL